MKSLLFIFLSTIIISAQAQDLNRNKKYFVAAIGFWNVENLYDTINDKWKNDEDFTPAGINGWTANRYRTKIDHLSEAISQMGTDVSPDGLAILGLCEVENKSAALDLARAVRLESRNYQVIHIEGPDARGVDPSLLYNPKYFKPKKSVAYRVKLFPDSNHKTRDILVVSGMFMGETLTVLVNHWPSRRNGEKQSSANRKSAAKVAKHIADSITTNNAVAKIIIMGDFNDDPVNQSVKKIIGTCGSTNEITDTLYFNPMEKPYREGIGTLAWQDSWNLFDQVLLNHNWLNGDRKAWQYSSVRVFNPPFLKNDYGRFKGYPLRTYSGPVYTGGYSDHFPVYILIVKEKSK
ncbi:MAG: endonuclease/exonuclease/phosphatase family protein [Bacteroidota bacterium]